MDKKLINEDIQNMKYLFGYKPGKVISEQDIDYTTDDYLGMTEMDEDKDDSFLRRRLSTIEKLIGKYINEVEEEETLFSDEFEFADNIISWVVQDLTTSDYTDHNYDELTDLIKDNFGDYILSQYVESDFDDEDDEDDEFELDEDIFDGWDDPDNFESIKITKDDDSEDVEDYLEDFGDDSEDESFDFLPDEDNDHRDEMTETYSDRAHDNKSSIRLKKRSSRVVKDFLKSLDTENRDITMFSLMDCEYADFSDVDICGLPNLTFINLSGTINNFEKQGYKCASDDDIPGFYFLNEQ